MSLEEAQALNPSLTPLLAVIYADFQAAIDSAIEDALDTLTDLVVTSIEVNGDLNHDGANAGFRNTTPVPLASLVIDGSISSATPAVLNDVVQVLALQGLATNNTTA